MQLVDPAHQGKIAIQRQTARSGIVMTRQLISAA
ncbi:hypothetical protein Q644_26205 [Brucella intermedia 229E]|uniref:Uncharacterized protein n=1 Tax=Brucella intermedia 229E TaxID=1337887 RepID=U4V678_9HYPH|nr:hypothetical protein Q644_26205 [Brucella intermedia 229E]